MAFFGVNTDGTSYWAQLFLLVHELAHLLGDHLKTGQR